MAMVEISAETGMTLLRSMESEFGKMSECVVRNAADAVVFPEHRESCAWDASCEFADMERLMVSIRALGLIVRNEAARSNPGAVVSRHRVERMESALERSRQALEAMRKALETMEGATR